MFTKSSKGTGETGGNQPDANVPPSIVSLDMRVIGDLQSEGEIHIDGIVEGDIRSKQLLVSETATVRGEIVAESVRVHGTVNGQIKAVNVSLAKTARVNGDILHETLAIEKGAFLEGHCKRLNERRDTAETKVNLVPKTAQAPASVTSAKASEKEAAQG